MNPLLPPPGPSLQLLVAPPAFQRQAATAFLAELAQVGPVRVLDGGNRFDVLTLNRALRRRAAPFYRALQRIQVSRAFTCYQMTALLEQSLPVGVPTLVLNLLTTFDDENAPLPERLRLLGICLDRLRQAARRAPVLLILHPRPEEEPFLHRVQEAVDGLWEAVPPGDPHHQPPLF